MSFARLALLCLALNLIIAPARAASEPPLNVVTTFSLLGDMVQETGGSAVTVTSLVGPDGDAHVYQPTPADAKKIAQADIIVINGLHFEGWLSRLIDASGTKAKLCVASAGVRPRLMKEDGEDVVDPHAWQDLENAQLYVRNIAAALSAARPSLQKTIQARAEAYQTQMAHLDQTTRAAIAALPENKRKIITNHDAFGYFGQAYGVTFISPVGLSTEAEPSAADISALLKQIKTEGIRKLFIENGVAPRLMEQLAQDSNIALGGTLYADALSAPTGDAPTFLTLFKHNAHLMIEAMQGL